MPLADTAAALGRHTPYVPKCSVAALLDTLDDADRAWLVDALSAPEVFAVADIAAVLDAEGHAIRPATLRRHRKRSTISGCACP